MATRKTFPLHHDKRVECEREKVVVYSCTFVGGPRHRIHGADTSVTAAAWDIGRHARVARAWLELESLQRLGVL
jgi:hypothetical protein